MLKLTATWLACWFVMHAAALRAEDAMSELGRAVPRSLPELEAPRVDQLLDAGEAVEAWAADEVWNGGATPDEILPSVERLLAARDHVDRLLDETVGLRTRFVSLPESPQRREQIRQFLRAASALVDLSGRLRYLLRDAIDEATYALEADAAQFQPLVQLLLDYQSEIGARAVAYALFDPPKASGVEPFPDEVKQLVLDLAAAAGQHASVEDVADFLREEGQSAGLRLHAAEVLRTLGLPQAPPPGAAERPAIEAPELIKILSNLPRESDDFAERRDRLVDWLRELERRGVEGDTYRLGRLAVREGDWLLMRNPSPYNLFTDLSPGLFTHVGIVTAERGADGIRRFVIVDLPERGSRIPATNVDAYLDRTLHFFFLRHRDGQVAQAMGQAARQLIGNESQFDLSFETSRVHDLAGRPLDDVRVNTYCAGLLLLCALQTPEPRESFFPIPEFPAGGLCQTNLKTLGLSIGADFISPTGALFAGGLEIVGSRQPMYDPGREVKERIYDHFAERMITHVLAPSPDAAQMLTQRIAGLSRNHAWLARALARANGVSERMDLEAAAKAAAVIETLDEIADGSRDEFYAARRALAGPEDPAEDASAREALLQKHAALAARYGAGEFSPRQLRVRLVEYYCGEGQRVLDARFFPAAGND